MAAIFLSRYLRRGSLWLALLALLAMLVMLAAGLAQTWRPPATGTALALPSQVPSGSTVTLRCGALYHGTLDLKGKTGVTVRTAGACGKARISPGRAITGWRRHQGHVYAAPVDFTPQQVAIDGVPASAAHWPDRPWANSVAGMPAGDLAGATQVVLVNQSVVQARPLSGWRIDTSRPFYVEGKLWMLDRPGEWALDHGRLYVWAPDGASPEGRVWAAPDAPGIDADGSTGIVIDGVALFSCRDGISAEGAVDLAVRNTDITDSARDGIWASGSRGLVVQGSTVLRARRNGIDGWYGIRGATIRDTRIGATGMVGMPSATDGAILFGAGAGNHIERVHVIDSAYHGINVMRNRDSSVVDSVVERACRRLADCGAIYTSARDRQPLALRIEGNTVTHTMGREAIGIYLDDYANGVTVANNTVTHNQRGLVIHDGYDNVVSGNTFAANTVLHVALAQGAGTVHAIRITGNTFTSLDGEQTYNFEGGANYRTFATIDHNTYISNRWDTFGKVWDSRSAGVATGYRGWKELMRQDAHSLARDAPAPAQDAGSLTAP